MSLIIDFAYFGIIQTGLEVLALSTFMCVYRRLNYCCLLGVLGALGGLIITSFFMAPWRLIFDFDALPKRDITGDVHRRRLHCET